MTLRLKRRYIFSLKKYEWNLTKVRMNETDLGKARSALF